MDYEQLSNLNKEFAERSQLMANEFIELFQKWKKIDTRLTIVMALNLPVTIIMNMINIDKDSSLPRIVEDLPCMFERYLIPFVKIKDKWGKISSPEFCALYKQEYEKQFEQFFPSKEDKRNFEKWHKKERKKK